MRKFSPNFSALGLVIILTAAIGLRAHAQSSIFNVPSTDVMPPQTLYVEADYIAHPASYEKGGFHYFGPSIIYGLRKNFEVGLNAYYTLSSEPDAAELQPNIKWQFYQNEDRGIAAAIGSMLFIPLRHRTAANTKALAYTTVSKQFKGRLAPRFTTGAYSFVGRMNEGETRAGLLLGYEQPLHRRLSFVADWYSGHNSYGYAEALRESEELLRQAQKMEAIGRLAGGVAHDFNNILAVINGYCDMLLRRWQGSASDRQKIEQVRKAGARAASLTRQLLAFSRKQVLQPQVLDLNTVIADTEKMLRRLLSEDIEVRTVLAPEVGRLKADPGQIEQVLMNLVVNARDAMPQGGKITIETKDVELDEEYVRRRKYVKPGPYVMLAVSDTGYGMDAETQARIFEPFFTTKEKGEGTGLGLATVYGIVKQSGGSIWVYSEKGHGTTFKIYLPRVGEQVETPSAQSVHYELPQATETVLLVEDEEDVREMTREILAQNGYKVLSAKHGEDALQMSGEYGGPIQLLLTDVVMPRMSGRELADKLTPLQPQMRVLYMSGYTDDAIVHHGVLDQGTAFIEKPFTITALTRKIRETLRN